MEPDALSECLSVQHLHGPAHSQHNLNGKDGRSSALGQDIFTGTQLAFYSPQNVLRC